MRISETLLPEFDREMENTRKTLARVPDDKLDWTPHQKSMTMRALSTHLANLVSWTVHTIDKDSLDIAPVGQPPPQGFDGAVTIQPACGVRHIEHRSRQVEVPARRCDPDDRSMMTGPGRLSGGRARDGETRLDPTDSPPVRHEFRPADGPVQ